ncbi:type II secretion system protein [Rossellomorea aquimaris]|uniref:type II secretion system protein n=1 Tax=Rossellomorea aquimaris TaxID=189382 RepID=UPI0005C85AEF|nr:prepilin-type N-terminal cleavage/methylation domain-containing protein [Rossellomorea aquimaris]
MIHNERGLTLVEVLATLTILSIIGAVIWNVFFQGIHYTKKAVSQNSIQQEANILTMKLTRIHQTSEFYELENPECTIKVKYSEEEEEFHHSDLCFSLEKAPEEPIKPSKSDYPLLVTITDKHHPNNKFVIDTTLYRLKGSNHNE